MADMKTFTGAVQETDNSHGNSGKGPYRFSLKDVNNQTLWFSTFDKPTEAMIEKGGVGNAWTVEYQEKEWTGTNGQVRVSNDVKTCKSAGQIAPAPAPTPQPQSIPVRDNDPDDPVTWMGGHLEAFGWADSMDDRGRSIIRQVAFKDVANKDDKTPEQIWNLTNLYESIMMGSYQPDADAYDEFLEQDPLQ
jgi:hypothetical protein